MWLQRMGRSEDGRKRGDQSCGLEKSVLAVVTAHNPSLPAPLPCSDPSGRAPPLAGCGMFQLRFPASRQYLPFCQPPPCPALTLKPIFVLQILFQMSFLQGTLRSGFVCHPKGLHLPCVLRADWERPLTPVVVLGPQVTDHATTALLHYQLPQMPDVVVRSFMVSGCTSDSPE